MEGLTERQKQVLGFLKDYTSEKGYPPTISEIARELGLRWTKGVERHLYALEKKGHIKRSSGARAIEITGFSRGRLVPVIGAIAAGKPILAEENIEGTLSLDESLIPDESCFLLVVEGDSMRDAAILNGDYVLVRPQPIAEKGEIIAALIGDEATVKYFSPEKNRVVLKPANPDFEPIILHEGDDFKILGKVVAVFRIFSPKTFFGKI